MLLSNLAEPEWIQVECGKKLLASVICVQNQRNQNSKQELGDLQKLMTQCTKLSLAKNNKCFKFQWYEASASGLNVEALSLRNISFLRFIFDAVTVKFPAILSIIDKNNRFLNTFSYTKILNNYHFQSHTIDADEAEGYFVISSNRQPINIISNIFIFMLGSHISQLYICDGNVDCPFDDSDEEFAICKITEKRHYLLGHYGYLHSTDIMVNHQKYVTNEERKKYTSSTFISCKNSITLDQVFQNDLVADCGSEGEDEPILISLLKAKTYLKCKHSYELPCREGHSKCYNTTDICIYRLDVNNYNIPCRTGDHLQNCKEFECDITFKCQESYCIPWSYICDGKWDCPDGEDETCESILEKNVKCIHMYKCKAKFMCIHLASLCDSYVDCPLGDDEILCGLKHTKCPILCQCIRYALYCKNITMDIPHFIYPFMSISFVKVNFILSKDFLKYFPECFYITINRNNLPDVCSNYLPLNVIILDVRFNSVKHILKGCFTSLFDLKGIYLDFNNIVLVSSLSFVNLSNLQVISLSNNPLYMFDNHIVLKSRNIKLVSIKNVSLENPYALKYLKVEIIYTSDFHLCCLASNSKCIQLIPWYTSCSDLLPTTFIKISFIGMTIILLLINFLSILTCTKINSSGKTFSEMVLSINFTDLFCGIYISIFLIKDLANNRNFVLKEEKWRSDLICFIAFGIITWFSISIQCFLLFLSFSSLMIVIYPVETRFKNLKFISNCLNLIFLLSLSLVFFATFALKRHMKHASTPLCLPFVDPTKSEVELIVITWFVIISQFLTSLVILSLYIVLVKNVQKCIQKVDSNKFSVSNLIIQLVLSTLSNFLCWIPCHIIFISTMFLPKYPMSLVTWTTVAAMPLRSVTNPAVFIIMSIKNISKCKKETGNTSKWRVSIPFNNSSR